MAEVKMVSAKMQLEADGGLLRATYEMATASKAVISFSGEIGVTDAELGNKQAAGGDKAVLGNKEAAGSSTVEIGVDKAPALKESVGCSTPQIGLTKLGHQEAVGSSTREVRFTKAELGHKEAGGSSSREVGVARALLANKDAAGGFTGGIRFTKPVLEVDKVAAPTAYVKEASWIDYVNLCRPRSAPKLGRKAAEPTEAMVTRMVTVPDTFIHFLRNRRPFMRMPPIPDETCKVFDKYGPPKTLELLLQIADDRNCCVDLHEDILSQHAKKGFAEVGVHFTADGVKNFFVLPQQ